MSNFKPIKLYVSDEMRNEAKIHKNKINKMNGQAFKQYAEEHNYFGELGELSVINHIQSKGLNVIPNKVYGTGNDCDLIIKLNNGNQLKADVKVRRFDNSFPNEGWVFPLFFKEWIKMIDWHTMRQNIDLIIFAGYDSRADEIILYGVLSPLELYDLYTKYNIDDELPNSQREVRYYPAGYWLKGGKAREMGILSSFKMFNDLDSYLNLEIEEKFDGREYANIEY